MEKLNLSEIERKLNMEFERGTRIIFWYDADASFSDSVDNLQLEDVIIYHLTETNAFRTKIMLEHDDTKGNYLIYAPFAKPSADKNHLEDTLRYSKEFYADKLSLIAADIRLPDRLQKSLYHMQKFFGTGTGKTADSAERTNQFVEKAQEIDLYSSEGHIIYLIAMCVLTKARNVTVDDLIYSVLAFGDIGEQEIIGKFHEMDLDPVFWEICQSRFGYIDEEPSLQKFVMCLFATYVCKDFRGTIPKKWKHLILNKKTNVNVLVDNMMNSVLYQNAFDQISDQMSDFLNAAHILQEVSLEDLLECSAFKEIDSIFIRWMIDREEDENKLAEIRKLLIPEICRIRKKMHFGKQYSWEYTALECGYQILHAVGYHAKEDILSILEAYCNEDYKIDTAYRKFIYAFDRLKDSAAFENLKILVENIYYNEYLERNISAWNTAYLKSVVPENILKQANFYDNTVEKVKEKVAVIISDAFRYEAARELVEKLEDDQNCTVEFYPMIGMLPSYTAVGMAALLPHTEISMKGDYSVLVDDESADTTEKRERILQKRNKKSAAITYKMLKEKKGSELKSFSTGKEVIYIYHNKIDATGENIATENSVFDACEDAVTELFDLIKYLSKSGNIYRFIVTADHGFIYTRRKPRTSDKLENRYGKKAFTDRRFIIDMERMEEEGVYAVNLGEALGTNDSRMIMLAKGMSVFKTGGGMHYVHGGSSAQEMILPNIFVKTRKGVVSTELARIMLVSNINKISNLLVILDFLQEEPVSDIIKSSTYRLFFVGDDGELISNEIIYKADSSADDPRDRMFRLKFNIKRKIYNFQKKYFLKIMREENNIEKEYMKRQIIMDLPYTNDDEV